MISEGIKSKILIDNTNIIQNRLSNNYIRNLLNNIVYPPARFFWSSVFADVNWRKAWQTVDKFYINNTVKEVSFKIMHRIYPDMLNSSLQLSGFDVIMYFGDHGFDKDKAYFIQLLMGKFHIHKMKWSGSKPNFSHFISNFNLYCKALCNCIKAIRSFVILILFIFKKCLFYIGMFLVVLF